MMFRTIAVTVLAAMGAAIAQPPPPPPPPPPPAAAGAVWVGGGAFEAAIPPPAQFQFIAGDPGAPGKLVKNAPYTAEGISETVQILGDGTRITRRNTKKFARDSQGRTREEFTLSALGPWSSAGEAQRMIHITDPVAGEMYILNDKNKTAHKLKIPHSGPYTAGGGAVAMERRVMRVERKGSAEANVTQDVVMIRQPGGDNVKQESLGKQTMEGLAVEGTRITRTIPANEIGNDRPIVSVTESWQSAELQVTVRSTTKDPQFGETDYRLGSVKRGEPDASLFKVPAGYTLQEGGGAMHFERRIESAR